MKVRRVSVTPEIIADVLTVGHVIEGKLTITEGLPPGSTLVGIGYNAESRSYALDFVHESFEEVASGCVPTTLSIVISSETRAQVVIA